MSTENLSDLSGSTSRKISIVARNRSYSDLDVLFQPHPLFGDIIPLKDLDAIKRAVTNLILTDRGERPFQPDLGSNIRGLLFEPADFFTIEEIKTRIKRVLEKYEPRIDNIQVNVTDQSDENRYFVTLNFRIINVQEQVEITIPLERIR